MLAQKFRLFLLFLLTVAFSMVIFFTAKAIVGIQKINNYQRCMSVVRVAKITGKLKDKRSIQEICRYHLE